MSTYRKDFVETKYMFFLIKDDELLKKKKKNLEKGLVILYTTKNI